MFQSDAAKTKAWKIFLIAAAIVLFCLPSVWAQVLGDANGNGSVDIVDALLTAQYYVGLNPANFQSANADVNCSSTVDIVDALLIARYYVGLITTFPCSVATPETTPAPTTVPGTATIISLNGNSISVSGSNAVVSGTTVTITAGGTYTVAGSLSNGQIAINSADANDVFINLNNVNITNTTTAPINVISAENTEIVLMAGTTNYVTDGPNYVFPDAATDEPNAAIFAGDDLKFSGEGTLVVKGNYNDGIGCKNDITIKKTTGTINVTAVDDGIRGKDSVEIKGGNITVNAGGDGLKADEDTDVEKGFILISAGTVNVTSGGDALTAVTTATVTAGTLSLVTAGGSSATISADFSAKGIKGTGGVTIDGGTITANCADDAVHSNGAVIINGGTFTVATGDDAFHSDTSLTVNNGTINISKSYEGLEALSLTINNGNIHLVADDDGLNAASATETIPGMADNSTMFLNGGYVAIDITNGSIPGSTGGDGIDCNGVITIAGGTYIVHGSNEMDSVIDYDGSCVNNGGFFLGAGSSRMAMVPGNTSSTQNSLLINLTAQQQANTLVRIQNSSGTALFTFRPTKVYQSIAFSSPLLVNGTYTVLLGGTMTGTATDGLFESGTYSGGTQNTTFTVSGRVTQVGSGSMWP